MGPQALVRREVKRMPRATTIEIEPDRFRVFFWHRRMTLRSIGPLINGCDEWASAMLNRGHCGYYALDDLAVELGLRVQDLIDEFGTDAERDRIG